MVNNFVLDLYSCRVSISHVDYRCATRLYLYILKKLFLIQVIYTHFFGSKQFFLITMIICLLAVTWFFEFRPLGNKLHVTTWFQVFLSNSKKIQKNLFIYRWDFNGTTTSGLRKTEINDNEVVTPHCPNVCVRYEVLHLSRSYN